MARRKEMIPLKGPQPFIDESFCAAGMAHGHYMVTVGPVTLGLTKEEKERVLATWSQLENDINPETGIKFTTGEKDFLSSH
jgi:hypothetical protein